MKWQRMLDSLFLLNKWYIEGGKRQCLTLGTVSSANANLNCPQTEIDGSIQATGGATRVAHPFHLPHTPRQTTSNNHPIIHLFALQTFNSNQLKSPSWNSSIQTWLLSRCGGFSIFPWWIGHYYCLHLCGSSPTCFHASFPYPLHYYLDEELCVSFIV